MNPRETITRRVHALLERETRINLHRHPVEISNADGVVARAVSRLVTIASGLDPHGLGVPEVFWMRHSGDYRAAARGFSSGTPDGLAAWLVLSARALHAGAREALAIATAASS